MKKIIGLAALLTGTALSPAMAQEAIKIGLLATLEGPFTVLGQDAQRGAELAVKKFGGAVDGHVSKSPPGNCSCLDRAFCRVDRGDAFGLFAG